MVMVEAVDWDQRWRFATASSFVSRPFSCAALSVELRRRFRRGEVEVEVDVDADEDEGRACFLVLASRCSRCGLQARMLFGGGRASRWELGESARRTMVSTEDDDMEFEVESRRLRPVVEARFVMATVVGITGPRVSKQRSIGVER